MSEPKEFYLSRPKVKEFIDNYKGNSVDEILEVVAEENVQVLSEDFKSLTFAELVLTASSVGLIYSGKHTGLDFVVWAGYICSGFGVLSLSATLGALYYCNFAKETVKKIQRHRLQQIAQEILEEKLRK